MEKKANTSTPDCFDDTLANVDDQQSVKTLQCDHCEFKSATETGIKIHASRKHKDILQCDGNISLDENNEVEDIPETSEDTTKANNTEDTTKELTQEEFQRLKDAINDWRSVL